MTEIASEDGSRPGSVKVPSAAQAQAATGQLMDNWLERAAYWEGVAAILEVLAPEYRRDTGELERGELQKALILLHTKARAREGEAWRNAMLFGLTLGPNARKGIRRMAFTRFLGQTADVMQHLEPETDDGGWSKKSERRLRMVLRKAFGIKVKKKVKGESTTSVGA